MNRVFITEFYTEQEINRLKPRRWRALLVHVALNLYCTAQTTQLQPLHSNTVADQEPCGRMQYHIYIMPV